MLLINYGRYTTYIKMFSFTHSNTPEMKTADPLLHGTYLEQKYEKLGNKINQTTVNIVENYYFMTNDR